MSSKFRLYKVRTLIQFRSGNVRLVQVRSICIRLFQDNFRSVYEWL
jgi:hypothetical protein